jgi:hypothetical protein
MIASCVQAAGVSKMKIAGLVSRTFAMLGVAAWLFAQQAAAQTYNIVQIRAYDSKGVNTGRCMTTRSDGAIVLDTCVAFNAAQYFAFDTNGAGGAGARLVSIIFNFPSPMAVGRCLGVATGSGLPNGGWSVRAPIIAVPTPCKDAVGSSSLWRWTNQQIVATQSPGQQSCLTFVQAWGPTARLGDCSKPETLTHWDVLINTCVMRPAPGLPCTLP